MRLEYDNFFIREAMIEDVEQLYIWWNNGSIMEHAGFPYGLGISLQSVKEEIEEANGKIHIIFYKAFPIGEMYYYEVNIGICEIGIKICDFSKQNQGFGKIILSLFIQALFDKYGYKKIILNTNLNNKRSQHVYERLGFKKVCINQNSWKDQLGNWQSSVEYELTKDMFISFL